jgi:hypothetical protein
MNTATTDVQTGNYVIGFGGQFFTLWHVSDLIKEYFGPNESDFYLKVNKQYIQNLATTEEEAIARYNELSYSKNQSEINTDLELKGSSRWERSEPKKAVIVPFYLCRFNQIINLTDRKDKEGKRNENGIKYYIPTEEDYIKVLWRNFLEESRNNGEHIVNCLKRRVVARRSLINLGVLIAFEGEYLSQNRIDQILQRRELEALKSGHHLEDKVRTELELKEVNCKAFEGGQWGTFYIVTYTDTKGRKFNYKGGTPPELNEEGFTKVKATPSHDEYKGEKQTILKRISKLKK